MKPILILFILFLSSFIIKAQQSSFCDGFEKGFKQGKKYLNERASISPICPIVSQVQNTYEYGYSVGYGKAIGKEVLLISNNKQNNFEDGFKSGYELVMAQQQKYNFSIPITPIAPINGDDYESGYLQGIAKAYEKLKIRKPNNTVIMNEETNIEKTFCNGWEDGYKFGLKDWATEHHKSVPLKTIPICPIAKINKDSYQHGFDLGLEKATKDCNSR